MKPASREPCWRTAEAGLVVGSPVSATDTDNVLPLTYRLQGPDAGLVRLSRVIRTDYGRSGA